MMFFSLSFRDDCRKSFAVVGGLLACEEGELESCSCEVLGDRKGLTQKFYRDNL